MSNDNFNPGWLQLLKPGDEVAISQRHEGWRIGVVEKRTPTGRITLTTGERFDKRGWLMTDDRWGREFLRPVTQDIRDQCEAARLLSFLRNVELTTLKLDQLRRMAAIAKEQA